MYLVPVLVILFEAVAILTIPLVLIFSLRR